MKIHEYFYSLRLGVDPKSWNDQKMSELKKFISEALIDDVNIIINSEELNVGHISMKQLTPWLDITQRFKEELEPLGVTVSMNPWTTILHSDRGRVLSDNLKFGTMVDYQGRQATAVACPADSNFIDYISEIYGEYAKKTPNYLWMDDDFRHFNHKPLIIGCFCDHHMALYNNELGTTMTREEFCHKIFQSGKPTKERLVFLKQARKEMNQLAKSIAEAVRKNSNKTKLGLMTSQPEWHALEARDWRGLFENLSIDQPPVARPHLPSYNEIPGLKYIREFNRNVRPVAQMMGKGALMFPELENYMYSTYAKSNSFTQLQLETTLLIGAQGVLFNFFDMMGNGIVTGYGHQHILKESKPLLNYSVKFPIQLEKISGVKVLFSQDTVYTRQTTHGKLEEMLPREYEWLSLLSTFGISTTLVCTSEVQGLTQEVVAVSDQVLRNLNNHEIIQLFTHNRILLDGTSVEILFDRNLEYLIHAKSYESLKPHTGYHTYEEWNGSELIENVENARMTVMQQTGDLTNITYMDSSVSVLTTLYNEKGKSVGNGMSIVADKHFILPINYHLKYAWDAQYINYKEKIIKAFLANQPIDYLVDMPVVQLIRETNRVYISNFTVDSYNTIKVKLSTHAGLDQIKVNVVTRNGNDRSTLINKGNYFELEKELKGFETIIVELLD
ncbi:hypothetical protein [Virgibacillus pantothenticus]|uniref:hypothetical protein n=1 Tax=Virgibacillus pantothenticus TaxID=1473 RepID=UPI000984BF46|nr:hypothetical protein [Virgibacillus pantothenticus]